MRGKIDLIEEAVTKKRKLTQFKPGDTIELHYKIKEQNTERIQVFDGVVIAINGSKGSKTFTVRKVMQGIGVEKVIPFNSPNISKIKLTKVGKVRRSKLYYLRSRVGRKARIKEVFISQKSSGKEENVSQQTEAEAKTA